MAFAQIYCISSVTQVSWQLKYIKWKERDNMTLFCFHSSWKAKKQREHKRNILQLLQKKDYDLYDMEKDSKNTAQYMLSFCTSNFSLGVGKKEKVLSCLSLWTSIWCTIYCLLFAWPASRSLSRWLLSKVRWMHILWRLWVSTQIMSMLTAWCGPWSLLVNCLVILL